MTLDNHIENLNGHDERIDDPNFRKAKIEELRKLVKESENLESRSDDNYLTQFLRARQYNVQSAYGMLRSQTHFNRKYTNSWQRVERSDITKVLNSGMLDVLSENDSQGRKVFWLRVGLWKPRDINSDICLQMASLLISASIANSTSPTNGIVAIFDMKDLGFTQIKSLTPTFAKKMIHFLSSCLPTQLVQVHIIRESTIFGMIFAIFKKFMSEEMQNDMVFHGHNMNSLEQYVNKNILPPELEGNGPEEHPSRWLNIINKSNIVADINSMGISIVN